MKIHFPIFQLRPELIFLDSASTSQKLRCVIEREQKFYLEENANVHRGLYPLSANATRMYEHVRQQVADFIGARSANEIAFTKGATESINIVSNSFKHILKPGDSVAVTQMEHHANYIPWQQACIQTGASFNVVPITPSGELNLIELDSILTRQTKILVLTHISNVLGTINPIEDIIKLAHKKNIPVLVDAAQSVGHMPIHVTELNVDFLVFSAHKMYGPMGVGVLYVKGSKQHLIQPLMFGGGIVKNVTETNTDFQNFPKSVEAGTPNVAGVVSLGAAIEFLSAIDLNDSFKQTQNLARAFRNELQLFSANAISILGNPKNAGPIVSFICDGIHAHDVASHLAQHHVAVRAGHHCAQPLHDALGVSASVRVSFSIYNSEKDVDHVLSAFRIIATKANGVQSNKLYHTVIKEQNEHPYHFKRVENSASKILSNSPVCGDTFEIYFDLEDDVIKSAHFYGIGCAVSKASVSVLVKFLEGQSISKGLKLCDTFLALIDQDAYHAGEVPDEFAAFIRVKQFPERYDCAALPWLETQKFLKALVVKSINQEPS